MDLALAAAMRDGADTILIITDGLPEVKKVVDPAQVQAFQNTLAQWQQANAGAKAQAVATSSGGGIASANAQANGGTGGYQSGANNQATAQAVSAQNGVQVTATGTSGSANGTQTMASAQFGTAPAIGPYNSTGAALVALPSNVFATALIGGATNTAAALLGAQSTVYGAGSMAGTFTGNAGTLEMYEASGQFLLSAGTFSSGHLMLGLIGAQNGFGGNSSGFSSIRFEVAGTDGIVSFDRIYNFTTLADADTFFTDNTIDLGFVTDPDLSVNFTFDLFAQDAGSYGYSFAFGTVQTDVPEPASGLLLLAGGAALAAIRRRWR